MVTVPTDSQSSRLKIECLTQIDISKLSQSELYALSLCSSSAFDLRNTDLVVPKIDRSLFNESAGSRRQTYSRLRPSTASGNPQQFTPPGHRRRLAGLLPIPKPTSVTDADDPERRENETIVKFLKDFIEKNSSTDQLGLVASQNADVQKPLGLENRVEPGVNDTLSVTNFGERKRKRGRKPKAKVHGEGGGQGDNRGLEIVNKNGVVVDLLALENTEDPYVDELKRRTVGLETEEECLAFLRDLDGEWGSRRKKRKIVDASHFGDALPVGWKLLLALRRKEGRASVYCRRYISPTRQQFGMCKEASSFLQSHFGRTDDENQAMASGILAGITANNDIDSHPPLPILAACNENKEKEVLLLGNDNLAEVQVRDIFDCHKCNLTFEERNPYLEHLLTHHQKTTRRFRLNSCVGDGVIVKDGKYECQFCHKVFEEKHRYNGHVGIHVRNYVRRSEEHPVQKEIEPPPSRDDESSRRSKMNALLEIAQNSMVEASHGGQNDKSNGCSPPNVLKVASTEHEPKVSEVGMEDDMSMEQDLNENGEDIMKSDQPNNIVDLTTDPCNDDGEKKRIFDGKDGVKFTTNGIDRADTVGGVLESHLIENNMNVDEMGTYENSELEIGFGRRDDAEQTCQEYGSSEDCFAAFNANSNKEVGEGEYSNVKETLTGFEELKLDDIEPLKFNFGNEQELGSSGVFGLVEEKHQVERRQLTTVCVWCEVEFNLTVDYEIQADSVGFMCPDCKAKISDQLNAFNSGLSINSHSF